MILEAPPGSKVLVFSALKGDFLKREIEHLTGQPAGTRWDLITDYHFGGYAKYDKNLLSFLNDFYDEYDIPLDPVYTGKLFYGLTDLAGGIFSQLEVPSLPYIPEGCRALQALTSDLAICSVLRPKKWFNNKPRFFCLFFFLSAALIPLFDSKSGTLTSERGPFIPFLRIRTPTFY